jgi:hypothetical protein
VEKQVQSLIEPEQAHPGVEVQEVPEKNYEQEDLPRPRRYIREIWLLKRAS